MDGTPRPGCAKEAHHERASHASRAVPMQCFAEQLLAYLVAIRDPLVPFGGECCARFGHHAVRIATLPESPPCPPRLRKCGGDKQRSALHDILRRLAPAQNPLISSGDQVPLASNTYHFASHLTSSHVALTLSLRHSSVHRPLGRRRLGLHRLAASSPKCSGLFPSDKRMKLLRLVEDLLASIVDLGPARRTHRITSGGCLGRQSRHAWM